MIPGALSSARLQMRLAEQLNDHYGVTTGVLDGGGYLQVMNLDSRASYYAAWQGQVSEGRILALVQQWREEGERDHIAE
ncbi:MAG TPA: hypothetical protein VFU47_02395, partial [Armatimonadota bacterium]|nr:hypothetical protein [Armatimonadota bacterium]